MALQTQPIKRQAYLTSATTRDYSGGLNVVDNDLNLTTKYMKQAINASRDSDGSLATRPGTKLFVTASDIDEIINIYYWNTFLIVVGKNGKIVRIDGRGSMLTIWNDTIAATLSGSPPGWRSGVTFVSFAEIRGYLWICNGVDKPLWITPNGTVEYANDLATGSNVNTPIGRYVAVCNEYVVIAGDPEYPERLHISAKATIGTFYGDPAPNDAVTYDLLPPRGDAVITGIKTFRDRLIVTFEQCSAVVLLGTYESTTHVPSATDWLEEIGNVSHRTFTSLGDELLMCDGNGVPSLARAIVTNSIRPDRLSQFVDPAIQYRLSKLDTTALRNDVWSVYDSVNGRYILMIPGASRRSANKRYYGFVYTSVPKLKIEQWHEWRGWRFQAGCVSALKTVFLTKGNKVYIMGGNTAQYERDAMEEQEPFSDGTSFSDATGFAWNSTSGVKSNATGIPIKFAWEFPWADHDARVLVKASRYLALDMQGGGQVTVQMFCNNIYEDRSQMGEAFRDGLRFSDGTGFITEAPTLDPTLSLQFIAGDLGGYGASPYGQYYGGGRPSAREQLYAWPSTYKIAKMRFEGIAYNPVKLISFSVMYMKGSIRS